MRRDENSSARLPGVADAKGEGAARRQIHIRRCASEGFLTIEELGLIKSGKVVFDWGLAASAGGVRQEIIAGWSKGSVGI
jgi:hypothetical protein